MLATLQDLLFFGQLLTGHGGFADLSRSLAVFGLYHELTDGRGSFTETVKGLATGTAVTTNRNGPRY